MDIGAGGAGGPAHTSGQPGTSSTVNNGLGGVVEAKGGLAAPGNAGGLGGGASCPGQGTTRDGNIGGAGGTSIPALGGRPAVDGVIQPAPAFAGIGGSGGPGIFGDDGARGGPGYVVIWW
ncbi:hypothetical protein ACFV3E_43475 [Streptomyces sp. NPDC059718]